MKQCLLSVKDKARLSILNLPSRKDAQLTTAESMHLHIFLVTNAIYTSQPCFELFLPRLLSRNHEKPSNKQSSGLLLRELSLPRIHAFQYLKCFVKLLSITCSLYLFARYFMLMEEYGYYNSHSIDKFVSN